ncbi:MAG: ABC transporter substrate-binding protein [Dehalococcoidia bacterium]
MANYWATITQGRMARRRLLRTGAAFSVGAASLALIGCGSDDGGDDDSNGGAAPEQPQGQVTGSTGDPKPGGRFGTSFATIGNYNVAAFYHDGYNNSGITAYDRLITARIDKRGYVLEAAASIELPDPMRVVIKLKPGMVFQNKAPVNGHKVTSADIVATQQYIKQMTNAENSGFIRQYVTRYEAPDENTVIYHLNSPLAYLFSSTYMANPTSQPMLPKEILDVIDSTPAIGSGPFELVDHTFGVKYLYKKFDQYREAKAGKPYFAERETFGITDVVALEAAFRSEQTHVWDPPAAQVDRLTKELDSKKFANVQYLSPGQSTFNAMMNFAQGGDRPWKDIRFREAIYRLTNRQQFIDLSLSGRGVVPPGPIQASAEPYQLDPKETEKFFKQDVAAAKQLLAAMNYDTSKEWETVSSNSNAVNTAWAEIWQQQLSQAGIKTRPVAVPLAELLPKKLAVSNFDFHIGGQPGGDTPFRAMRNQHSDTLDQFNNVGLFDKSVDALIEKSEQATNRDENIKLVKQVQMEALNRYSLSYVFLTQQVYRFYNAKLQAFEIDPLTGQNYQINTWMSA